MAVLLHHDVTGPADAPLLVLSGSVGSTIEMWEPNLAALSRTFRVVRLDHRGHGGSPVVPGPYRIADLAGDAVATLDALGVGTFSWCGLSMGAMIGMAVAADHPQRVASLVLCCTSAHFADPSVWRERADALARSGTASLAPGIVSRWFTPRWAQEHPAAVHRAVGWVSRTSDEGYRACCQAIAAWDHRARLSEVAAPTLVIAGAHDVATPVEPDARILVDSIPDARLEVLDAAHVATVEAPAAATELIRTHVAA